MHTVQFSCKEVGQRLDELGLANDIHLRNPEFAIRFMIRNECMFVRDLPNGKHELGFLPKPVDLPHHNLIEPENLRD